MDIWLTLATTPPFFVYSVGERVHRRETVATGLSSVLAPITWDAKPPVQAADRLLDASCDAPGSRFHSWNGGVCVGPPGQHPSFAYDDKN